MAPKAGIVPARSYPSVHISGFGVNNEHSPTDQHYTPLQLPTSWKLCALFCLLLYIHQSWNALIFRLISAILLHIPFWNVCYYMHMPAIPMNSSSCHLATTKSFIVISNHYKTSSFTLQSCGVNAVSVSVCEYGTSVKVA